MKVPLVFECWMIHLPNSVGEVLEPLPEIHPATGHFVPGCREPLEFDVVGMWSLLVRNVLDVAVNQQRIGDILDKGVVVLLDDVLLGLFEAPKDLFLLHYSDDHLERQSLLVLIDLFGLGNA